MQTISNRSSGAIGEIFGREKVLIGMIHCPPFPGAPRYRGATLDSLYDACLRDAEAIQAMKDQRATEAQAQQLLEAAPVVSQTAANLAKMQAAGGLQPGF